MTQKERILNHLQKFGKLSQKGAIREYSAYRLSAIIYVLRKEGYKITTTFKTGKNKYGDPVSWGEYELIGGNDDTYVL